MVDVKQQLEGGCDDQIAQGVLQCRNASEVHQASKTTLKKLGRCLAANLCIDVPRDQNFWLKFFSFHSLFSPMCQTTQQLHILL